MAGPVTAPPFSPFDQLRARLLGAVSDCSCLQPFEVIFHSVANVLCRAAATLNRPSRKCLSQVPFGLAIGRVIRECALLCEQRSLGEGSLRVVT